MPGTYISPAETTLYYLQSRYYDPEIGRFINADSYVSTGQGILGNNMFAYCLNNPVIHVDYSGCSTQEKRVTPIFIFVIIDDGCGSPEGDQTGGGGGVSPIKLLVELAEVLCKGIRFAYYSSKKGNDDAVFYGMDLYGGTENIITDPMTFDQAASWAIRTAASGKYSSWSGWGLYTENRGDALMMTVYLSKSDQFEEDGPKKGHYSHFHTAFRQIYGFSAESFHMWYGEKGV